MRNSFCDVFHAIGIMKDNKEVIAIRADFGREARAVATKCNLCCL
jgi:hypothetical protein